MEKIIADGVKKLIFDSSGITDENFDWNISFFDMGYSSINLQIISQGIESEFGVDVSVDWFFDSNDDATPLSLANQIEKKIKDSGKSISSNSTKTEMKTENRIVRKERKKRQNVRVNQLDVQDNNPNEIGDVIMQQLWVMSKQLEMLSNDEYIVEYEDVVDDEEESKPIKKNDINDTELSEKEDKPQEGEVFGPFQRITTKKTLNLNDKKLKYFNSFVEQYIEKTKLSREYVQKYRYPLANNRNVAGFKPDYKKMLYPIIATEAKGSKIKDLDGNEYVDIAMGFGVYLLGHKPDFVIRAAENALLNGAPLGPMSYLPGKVAELICELAHVERAAFYNSGTEAVMVALRLARAATKREKIVVFAGSYHGTFDGVLARKNRFKEGGVLPIAPGTPQHMIENVLVLDYGADESIKIIEENANDLAAIIVETVQSRNMDVQPKEFLQKLRVIANRSGATLIFDEVITGFRVAQGGAQEWFGVKADIVTYGKIAGGGFPIGIVAGKAKYLDGIDGGVWDFDDDSSPKFDDRRIFVAGTFCHHPVTMAAAYETLTYLKEQGPELQIKLNEKTKNMVDTLNSYFNEKDVPLRVNCFGSEFRFIVPPDLEIFFYGLINKGVHVWEGRSCFLSTAHSDEDIEFIISTVKSVVDELIENDFIKKKLSKIDVSPFNDFVYKNCFYNAFFSAIESKGAMVSELLVHSLPYYKYLDGRMYVDYKENCNWEELLTDKGINIIKKKHNKNLIDDIKTAINKNRIVLVWIDNYFEDIRKDTFNKEHMSHVLLISNYDDDSRNFTILEQSRFDTLDYSEKVISYDSLQKSYEGYIEYFRSDNNDSTYYEIWGDDEKYLPDNLDELKNQMIEMIKTNKETINESIEQVERYRDYVIQLLDNKTMRDKIDEIIEDLNNVINSKKEECFKMNRVLGMTHKLSQCINELADEWIAFRTLCARVKYSRKDISNQADSIITKLDKIIENERAYDGCIKQYLSE